MATKSSKQSITKTTLRQRKKHTSERDICDCSESNDKNSSTDEKQHGNNIDDDKNYGDKGSGSVSTTNSSFTDVKDLSGHEGNPLSHKITLTIVWLLSLLTRLYSIHTPSLVW